MKKTILLLLSLSSALPVLSQHQLVIGSKAPSFKDIEWIEQAPRDTDSPILIEFYQGSNPTSVKLLEKLPAIEQQYGDRMVFVVLTCESRAQAESLAGGRYFVGYDPSGDVFKSFGVRFTPFTMIVDSKGLLHWQGNLSNITPKALDSVK